MTLDEAIKHAEKFESLHERYENMNEDRLLFRVEENECKNCAKEHRQLANQLKELKQLTCEDIEIPNGATNGDILMSMFPNESFRILDNTVYTTIDKVGNTINSGCWFSLGWWNAPYKKGREE